MPLGSRHVMTGKTGGDQGTGGLCSRFPTFPSEINCLAYIDLITPSV
jgi:hypothetical protein